MLGKLIVAGAVVVGGGGFADVKAKSYVESKVEKKIEAEVPNATGTVVHISSFPFLLRLAGSGQAGTITLHLDKGQEGPFLLGPVDIRFEDVTVDTAKARAGKVVITKLGQGSATAVITDATLSELFKVPIRLTPGTVQVTVAGRAVTAKVVVADGTLKVLAPGLPPFSTLLPRGVVIPCAPEAEVMGGSIRLSCHFTELPQELVKIVGRVAG